MKVLLPLILAIAVASAPRAFAACESPPVVAVPDGAAATYDQMLQAQAAVRAYMEAMEAYRSCINEEIAAAGEDAPAEFRALMVRRHDEAVGEMEAVAAAFNEQLRAYRAANPSN